MRVGLVLQNVYWSAARRLAGLGPLVLVPLITGLGIALGLVFTSASSTLASSIVNVGVCAVITLKDPLTGFLVWFLLNPFILSFNLTIEMGAGVPDLGLDRVTIALILVILLAQAAAGKRKMLRFTSLEIWMVLTWLAVGVSVFSGADLTSDIQVFVDRYVTPFLTYFVARNLIVKRRHLNRFLVTVVALGAYCAVYGIYTQLTGDVLFVARGEARSFGYTAHLRQMRGLLGSPHAFGQVFSFIIPISFYKLIGEKVPWKKLGYSLTVIVLMVALFLTYKRAAWIGTIASFLIIQRFYPQFRRLFFVLLILAAVVMGLTWDQVSESTVVTERVTYKWETGNGRTEFWQQAIDLWAVRPILGYGWDGYRRLTGNPVENTYLYLLLSAGLAGLIPFLVVLVSTIRQAVGLCRLRSQRFFVEPELAAVFIGVMVSFAINIFTVNINHHVSLDLIWALAGAIAGSQGDALLDARAARRVERVARGGLPA
jgi:hypothetical protein